MFSVAIDQSGYLTAGSSTDSVALPTMARSVRPTVPVGGDGPRAALAAPFTSLMMDKRAPGLHTAAIAGPDMKLEWLAEQMVASGAVAEVARMLMSADLISSVNARILRNGSRFKQGTVIMSYPQLFGVMLELAGASSSPTDPRRVAARVLTELLARAYTAFNVMMPYRSFYTQSYAERPVATTADLIKGSFITAVTDVLEALRIGEKLRDREFAPAVVESVLGPALWTAANRLVGAERYNRWMTDAAIITGAYVANMDCAALEFLRDDPNLQLLATNASFAMGAMSLAAATGEPSSPAHEHVELLGYAALRLRELRRYEPVSLDKFASMYTAQLVKTPKGRICGAFITRNADVQPALKGITLHEEGGSVFPLPAVALDPYVPMLNSFASAAFGGAQTVATAGAISQLMIMSAADRSDDIAPDPAQVVAFCVTEDEILMLALAKSRTLMIATVGLGLTVHFGVMTQNAHYQSDAYYLGEYAYTSDPAETLLLLGEDHVGTAKFPSRPQTYPEELLRGILDTREAALYEPSTRELTVALSVSGDREVTVKTSLFSLLTGAQALDSLKPYVAIDRATADYVSSTLALGVLAFASMSESERATDRMLAEQIATAIHDLVGRYVKPAGFSRFVRTAQSLVLKAIDPDDRDTRELMSTVISKHALALRVAALLWVRTGTVPFGLHTDVVRMLSDANAVQRAATAEAFSGLISGSR